MKYTAALLTVLAISAGCATAKTSHHHWDGYEPGVEARVVINDCAVNQLAEIDRVMRLEFEPPCRFRNIFLDSGIFQVRFYLWDDASQSYRKKPYRKVTLRIKPGQEVVFRIDPENNIVP